TTAGVIIGLTAVMFTGWLWLDALLAIGVAIHILLEGYHLLRESISGLMDQALPQEEIDKIETLLKSYESKGIYYKKLKTRASASQSFVVVNILVPAAWPVGQAHDVADEIEKKTAEILGGAFVTTHLEPIEWYESNPTNA
ncbi:MAG: cation diffusion facilitator family transporter, partial [Saezia sp.]